MSGRAQGLCTSSRKTKTPAPKTLSVRMLCLRRSPPGRGPSAAAQAAATHLLHPQRWQQRLQLLHCRWAHFGAMERQGVQGGEGGEHHQPSRDATLHMRAGGKKWAAEGFR